MKFYIFYDKIPKTGTIQIISGKFGTFWRVPNVPKGDLFFMKNVLIFYASYGGGHLNAAKSINEYILYNYPDIHVELIDCMKYINKPIEKITTAAYREMAKKNALGLGKDIFRFSKRTFSTYLF